MKNNSKIIYILTIFLIIFCTFNLSVSYSAETYGPQQQVGEDWDVTESFEPDKWTPMENSTGGDSKLIDVGNKIRLYCLRLSAKILVFGNGGVKDAKRWEDSETLAPYVKMLMDTSRFIQSRINDGTIVLVDKEIIGNLNFRRYEKE